MMARGTRGMTYDPLGTLKPMAENVWIIDGPIIRFGLPWPKMPFSTRTTVIRLAGGLFVHSPTPLSRALAVAVAELGPVRWIVGPNRLHYSWISEWRMTYPEARVYLAPKIVEQARGRVAFAAEALDATGGYPWDAELATLPITSRFMTEVEFFHHPSRTLILTDLIENFEPGKLGFGMRCLACLGGALAPNGSTPRDMRPMFRGHRAPLRAAIETMLAWQPERIILAHGSCFDADGTAELRRALGWALAR